MKIKVKLFLIVNALVLHSCSKEIITFDTEQHFLEENYSWQKIKQNKIKIRKCYKIDAKDNFRNLSENKLNHVLYFDSEGLCKLKVETLYYNYGESNIPTGLNDSTFYFFENRKLVSQINSSPKAAQQQWKTTHNLLYDANNNLIQRCYTSNDLPNSCRYIKYKYDKDNKILTAKDSSFDIRNEKPYELIRKYKYNKKNQITFDGINYYEYTNAGQLKRKSEQYDNPLPYSTTEFYYDNFGNMIKTTSKTTEPRDLINYMYNANNLLIESQIKYFSDNEIIIRKYSYE